MGTAPHRLRRWLYGLGALVGVLVTLAGVKALQIRAMIDSGKHFVPPPESVSAAKAAEQQWQRSREAVGSVVAVRGVTLGAELAGAVRQIAFKDGTVVAKGDVLVRLDTTAEEAQLAGARADAEYARINFERQKTLRTKGAATQADLDLAQAQIGQAAAARTNLEAVAAKKVIRAPFAGRVGIRDVELGQVLAAGAKVVSLQSVDPIYVEFTLPQQALATLELGQRVEVTVDPFPLEHWAGRVTTINPEVDPTTRSVRSRATVPNSDGRLAPGMFARVRVLSDQVDTVVAVPLTAVQFAPYGDSVFVLGPKADAGTAALVATQRFVRLGDRRGDFVAASEGLDAGETVVSGGAFKLKNGMSVRVNDELAPPPELSPSPANR